MTGLEIEEALQRIGGEYEEARRKFPPFHSSHEGFAVIKEELDELWDAVKANDKREAKAEAMQVAAMALSFMLEI